MVFYSFFFSVFVLSFRMIFFVIICLFGQARLLKHFLKSRSQQTFYTVGNPVLCLRKLLSMEKEVPANHLYTFHPSLLFTDDDEETEIAESDINSTFGFLVYEFRNFFVDNIPIEVVKDLPKYSRFLFFFSVCFLGNFFVSYFR
jgi:hypothetical protein